MCTNTRRPPLDLTDAILDHGSTLRSSFSIIVSRWTRIVSPSCAPSTLPPQPVNYLLDFRGQSPQRALLPTEFTSNSYDSRSLFFLILEIFYLFYLDLSLIYPNNSTDIYLSFLISYSINQNISEWKFSTIQFRRIRDIEINPPLQY